MKKNIEGVYIMSIRLQYCVYLNFERYIRPKLKLVNRYKIV